MSSSVRKWLTPGGATTLKPTAPPGVYRRGAPCAARRAHHGGRPMRRFLIRPACGLVLLALATSAAAGTPQARVTLVRWPYT